MVILSLIRVMIVLNHLNEHMRLRGFDLDYIQTTSQQMDWISSVYNLIHEGKTPNGEESRRFFATMDVLQDPLSFDLDGFQTFGFISKASTDNNSCIDQALNGRNSEGLGEASVRIFLLFRH
jgi:hypothetical protein